MLRKKLYLVIIFLVVTDIKTSKFLRTIQGVGLPYYKILMSLGSCKGKIIFTEQLLWPSLKLNRILDIYYKSGNEKYKVSQVEITVVMNDTDCYAVSNTGVGEHEFTATMYLPTHLALMFYNLTVYTCNADTSDFGDFVVTQSEN
ncbi:hypothetical protein K1T71_010695 [Dendrolimus kikuchii]|uniref:Uncharacterized protein n=1 Tax=Dendrolimus kikuchii TaxID=765133 RepID=A0ACC1CPT8_9NEOP|nr:hypothetical protein K1T71_010695 [Dendrolimus kikuchii]